MIDRPLTLWDFKPNGKDLKQLHFERDNLAIWIQKDEKEMTVFMAEIQSGACQQVTGRTVKNLNEAVEMANKMYKYHLTKQAR